MSHEPQAATSESPQKVDVIPKWMEARLVRRVTLAHSSLTCMYQNTPSRSGRALPTVFECANGHPRSTAEGSGDDTEAVALSIPGASRSLLFRRSVDTITRDQPPHLRPSPLAQHPLSDAHAPTAVALSSQVNKASISAVVKLPVAPATRVSPSIEPSGSCSSCGVVVALTSLSTLRPCLHPLCRICINALLNAACHDPPPEKMECFLCQTEVEGFEKPSSEVAVVVPANPSSVLSVQSKQEGNDAAITEGSPGPRVRVKLPIPPLSPLRHLDWSASAPSTPSSTRTKGTGRTTLTSTWTTPSSVRSFSTVASSPLSNGDGQRRAFENHVHTQSPGPSAPRQEYPVVRGLPCSVPMSALSRLTGIRFA